MVAEDLEKKFFVQTGYKDSCLPNILNPSWSREATDSVEIRFTMGAGQRVAIRVSRMSCWCGKKKKIKENRNTKGVFAERVAAVALQFQILT